MTAKDLRRLADSPAAYRDALVIPGARGPVRFGAAMADFQKRDFAALDPALIAVRDGAEPPVGRFWFERTKGGSKDSDLAIALLWLLAFSPRPLACQVGAADQDQADELRKASKGVLRLNPWLGQLVTVQAWSLVNPRTDARCDIIAADVAGSHGARPDVLVLNELTHIARQEFAENLLDNASKVPRGLVVVATNAGFIPSWQWDWRENARVSSRWYFSTVTAPAPWLDPCEIVEARRRNSPSRFARLWEGRWVPGTGDALPADAIKRACTAEGPHLAAQPGFVYYGGLDLGVRRDHSAFVLVGLENGEKLRLADVQSWAPGPGGQVDLVEVRQAVLTARERFPLRVVFYDPFQAELLAEDCRRAGVPMEPVQFTATTLTTMATALLERLNGGAIELYPDPRLLTDLAELRLVERPFGGYRLDSPRNEAGHGDRATAFCLALLAAERHPCVLEPPTGDGIEVNLILRA